MVGTYLDYRISMKFKLVDDKYEFIGRDCSGKQEYSPYGAVVTHLTCNEKIRGSNPRAGFSLTAWPSG